MNLQPRDRAKALNDAKEFEQRMQCRGTNDDEYQIYVQAAQSLGWEVASYDEWLER